MKRNRDGNFIKKKSIVDVLYTTIRNSSKESRERVICNSCREVRDRNIKRMLAHIINCPQSVKKKSRDEMKVVSEEILNLTSNKQTTQVTTSLNLFPYAPPTENRKDYLNLL